MLLKISFGALFRKFMNKLFQHPEYYAIRHYQKRKVIR